MINKDIFWFDEIGKEENELVGKKCANLGEMTRLKLPVPYGFAISIRAFENFLKEAGAFKDIKEVLNKVGELNDIDKQAEISEKIRNIIERMEIPKEFLYTIESYYEQLCDKCGNKDLAVSVRSAGAKSHPGQYETYLNVKGKHQVVEKVKKVWSSIFNLRTISAMVQQGLPVEKSPCIGVAVLEMINAKSAGVCFTIHPVTGDLGKALIEANFGLGESVVSGRVVGDTYVLDKTNLTLLEKSMGEKAFQIIPKGEGVTEEEVPFEKRNTYALNDEEAKEIVRLCMFLESHFNSPQDVEWAISADKSFPHNIYLLQTRPVVGVLVQKPKSDIDQTIDNLLKKFF